MKAYPSNHDPKTGTMNLGMDLRDHFAAQAISGLVINYAIDLDTKTLADLAKASYKLADALMRARDE